MESLTKNIFMFVGDSIDISVILFFSIYAYLEQTI